MTSPTTPAWAWLVAVLGCVAGGSVWAMEWFVTWPAAVLVIAAATFLMGAFTIGGLSATDARRTGTSALAATRRGVAAAVRAMLSFAP